MISNSVCQEIPKMSSDLEQFPHLRPPQRFFFDHMSASDGLQPITELCELWPLKRKKQIGSSLHS